MEECLILCLVGGSFISYQLFYIRKKSKSIFSGLWMRDSSLNGSEKEKINSSNFSFMSHYKKVVFSFLFHPNKRKIFIFSFSIHLDKEHGNE